MMTSLVLNSIRSALNALESLERSKYILTYIGEEMKCRLKNLELFVLCARKLGNDGQLRFYDGQICTLASLLQRIHNVLAAPPYKWDSDTSDTSDNSDDAHAIDNLKKEIGGWYNTLLVSLPQPTSFDELNEIIDSLLDNLRLISSFCGSSLLQPIEALIKMITFLRNFIRFATLCSIESPQLLAHIHAVSVDVAHTSFMYSFLKYDVEPNIPVLLQMIKMADPQVDETYTQALTSSKLSTHLLSRIPDKDPDPSVIMKDFIDSLLWNLLERLYTDTPIVISTNSELRLVYEGLRLLRSMLKEQPNKFDQRVGELTRVVICDAGILIFSLYQREMEIVVPTSGLLQRINRITQIVNGKDFSIPDLLQRIRRVPQIMKGKDLSIPDLLQRIGRIGQRVEGKDLVPSQNRADEIVGFDGDITSIIDRLTRRSEQLKVLKMVAIVGMPGIGKTTLATKVFSDPSVTLRFQVRSSCCVSQLFHRKNVLSELLNHVDPNTNIGMSEQDLSEKLWKDLKGKRYLIFLDDVWGIEAWDSLKESFPDDSKGSRILVTSRHRDVVPHAMLDEKPLSPSQLTDDQSWELLQKKLPPGNERSPALDEIGKQIAANCKGLPLTVVIVAGLLGNTEPEGWKMFLESIRSGSGANHCMDSLELSYQHLPGHLKQCFLYFGLFPVDHEVSIKSLIQLWIAEGFVRNNESKKSLEEVGRDYMMDLVGRSLVMVSKERSRGGVKACRIHDLLHDFCRTKAKEENFVQVLEGRYDEFICFKESDCMRRLCVYSKEKHFKNLRVFSPHLHSLLFFAHDKDEERSGDSDKDEERSGDSDKDEERRGDSDISFIIPSYRRLIVLDISQYSLSLTFGIPSEIGLLLQLKYLSVTGNIVDIPSSIGSLANLETFILDSYECWVSMPDTFWNLQKLRHANIKKGFRLAFEDLEKFPELCELQSCSIVVIYPGESIERLVRKFPNIQKLGSRLYRKYFNEIEILIPDSLTQLESLALTSLLRSPLVLLDDLPGNLRKLTLAKFLLHKSEVSEIGELPNLEVLKFDEVDFHGDTWDMVDGEFSKLKFLELNDSRIVRWSASDDSDDQFPYLQKLVLRNCYYLEEIPCCLKNNCYYTLDMVEVYFCCHTVKNFFEKIRDKQEVGNSFLKMHIL